MSRAYTLMTHMSNLFYFDTIKMSHRYASHTFTRDQGDAQHLCTQPQMTAENQHVFKWLRKYRMLYNAPVDKEVLEWVQKYVSGEYMQQSEKGYMFDLTPSLIQKLKQYRLAPKDYIMLFRGIHFSLGNLKYLKQHHLEDIREGENVVIDIGSPSSWTFNYRMAEKFSMLGDFNYILGCKGENVYNRILVDLRLFPESCNLRDPSRGNLQDEDIMLPSTYECTLLFPRGYHKNFLWRQVNIPYIEQYRSFLKSYTKKIRFDPDPTRFRLMGSSKGGLMGQATIDSKNYKLKFVWDIVRTSQTNQYLLKYGLQILEVIFVPSDDEEDEEEVVVSDQIRHDMLNQLNSVSPLSFSKAGSASYEKIGYDHDGEHTEEQRGFYNSEECQLQGIGVANDARDKDWHHCVKIVTTDKFVGTLEQVLNKLMSTIDALYKHSTPWIDQVLMQMDEDRLPTRLMKNRIKNTEFL